MKRRLEALLRDALNGAVAAGELPGGDSPSIKFETPIDPSFGDFGSDLALQLARSLRRPPQPIAERLLARLRAPHGWLGAVEVAGPGFINLRLAPGFWRDLLAEAVAAGAAYGLAPQHGRRAHVELLQEVGCSPPGLAEARAAMVADATAQLLRAAGDVVDCPRVAAAIPGGARLGVRVARGREAVREIPVGPVQASLDGAPRHATLRMLLDEVGADAARFFLLLGRPHAPLELDLGLARRERTDNPLFYARYAQARLAAVLRSTVDEGTRPDLGWLGAAEDPLVRLLVSYPDVVDAAADHLEPQRILRYALDLAAAWHHYYNRSGILAEHPALARARLALVRCVQQVLRSAFGVVGCAPERP